MKHPLKYSLLFGALLAVCPCAVVSAGEAAHQHGTAREDFKLVTVTATVEAVNYTNREVTLKGPKDRTVTFTVDPEVKRLNEVKVGDSIRADYYVSLAAEIRPPTADEEKHPITITEGAGKAPPGRSPAAGGLKQYKVVTTITEIDKTAETVTVKGPRGNSVTARVARPELLDKAHVGDHVIIVYTEALAISLEKVAKGKSE
jgi:hypothetical protein